MALSQVLTLEAGAKEAAEFALVWDMPTIQFHKNGLIRKRYYTKFFGGEGISGRNIASYALNNYARWEQEISEWQQPILSDSFIPDWLKEGLLNQLYYIADGGTLWFNVVDQFPATDPRHEFGLFGYLEGHEYRMYNTYDVHFYASFALAQLWPNLQVCIQYMFRDTVSEELSVRRCELYSGKSVKRKVKDSIPHDLGDPCEDPFSMINSYNVHDVSSWRDLNAKFILQVYRDYVLLNRHGQNDRYSSLEYIDDISDNEDDLYVRSTDQNSFPRTRRRPRARERKRSRNDSQSERHSLRNRRSIEKWRSISSGDLDPGGLSSNGDFSALDILLRSSYSRPFYCTQRSCRSDAGEGVPAERWEAGRYLRDMYEACRRLVVTMQAWDCDGDGLIENTGSPDQTYDTWVMTGPSAYCGGLWLAALQCMKTMAKILEKPEDEEKYSEILEKGKVSFEEKLWSDTHYKYDSSNKNKHVVMAGQLAGQWYLRACGFQHEVFPKDKVTTTLKTIFDNNVMKFNDGKMGAVNGYVLAKDSKAGHVDYGTLQSEEVWLGVTYGMVALMLHEGMHEEAFKVAGCLHDTLTYQLGLNFEQPEALYESGNHRSIGYMRPLSMWALYHAISSQPLLTHNQNGNCTKL